MGEREEEEDRDSPVRGGDLLEDLGDFDSGRAEASVAEVPMMTMMYYVLGRSGKVNRSQRCGVWVVCSNDSGSEIVIEKN